MRRPPLFVLCLFFIGFVSQPLFSQLKGATHFDLHLGGNHGLASVAPSKWSGRLSSGLSENPSVKNQAGLNFGLGMRTILSRHLELNIEVNFVTNNAELYYESSYFAPLGNRNNDHIQHTSISTYNIQLPILLGAKFFEEKFVFYWGAFFQASVYNDSKGRSQTTTYVDEYFAPLPEPITTESSGAASIRNSLPGVMAGVKFKIIHHWSLQARYLFPLVLSKSNIHYRQTAVQFGITYYLNKDES